MNGMQLRLALVTHTCDSHVAQPATGRVYTVRVSQTGLLGVVGWVVACGAVPLHAAQRTMRLRMRV